VSDTTPTPEITFADAIALYLAEKGHGIAGQSMFSSYPPDDSTTPDEAAGVVSRVGVVDQAFGVLYGRPNASIVVRGAPNDSAAAERRAWAIWRELSNLTDEIPGVPFVSVGPSQTPAPTEPDSKRRERYTFDLEIYLDELT